MGTKTIANKIIECINNGNKVLVCGNGGSATQSQHFAGELVNKFLKNRMPLPMISLSADIAVITSIANDYGFEYIFSKQLQAIGNEGDLLITLSTSGKSKNIEAVLYAAELNGIDVISFPTNKQLNKTTPKTQEIHLRMIHDISKIVEDYFT